MAIQLIKSPNYVTGKSLGILSGVTARTIRNEIKSLISMLKPYGITICSEPGKGYYLQEQDKNRLHELLQTPSEGNLLPTTPAGRLIYYLSGFVFGEGTLYANVLEETLYISKSTLDKDMVHLQEVLEVYNLNLLRIDAEIRLIGHENSIREMMLHQNKGRLLHIWKLPDQLNITLIDIYQKVEQLSSNISNQYLLALSGEDYNRLIRLMVISIFRQRMGMTIGSEWSSPDIMPDHQAESLMEAIQENILEAQEIVLSSSEKMWLAYMLRTFVCRDSRTAVDLGPVFHQTLDKILLMVTTAYNLSDYEALTEELGLIISNMISGGEIDTNSDEGQFAELRSEYPLAAEMTIELIYHLSQIYDLHYTNGDFVAIAMVFATELEYAAVAKEGVHKQILIVNESGHLAARHLKIKLHRYFPMLDVVAILPAFRFYHNDYPKVDLVLTTLPLSDCKKPNIVIHPLLKDYDRLRITGFLNDSKSMHYRFVNLFRESLFIKGLESTNRFDVIEKLCSLIGNNGYANDSLVKAIIEREEISATSIGNAVAIPHAMNSAAAEDVIAVAILKKSIPWGNEKVRLVFLINIQEDHKGDIEHIFNSLFELISSKHQLDQLIHTNNYYDFIKIINHQIRRFL